MTRGVRSTRRTTVEIAGRASLLHVVLEHKSTVDPWTPLQLLRYAVRILDDHREQHPGARTLPPLLTVVVHHSNSGWTGGTQLLDLYDVDGAVRQDLAPFLPNLRFLLDDLVTESPESLSTRTLTALARLALLCLQRMREGSSVRRELRRLREAFLAALRAPDTGSALIGVLAYIAEVWDLAPEELREHVLLEVGPELEQVMTSTYDQLVNRGRDRGRVEGRAETLLELLDTRFGPLPDAAVDRVRGATEEQLKQWALRTLDADRLEQVFAGE